MKAHQTALVAPTFSDDRWTNLAETLSDTLRLTPTERSALAASKTARLIAALPFLAGCEQARRTALSRLAVYWLSIKVPSRWVFDHDPDDDASVTRRLACIARFEGGDPAVLDRGLALLALQMVCGYARDTAKDAVSGEYNPVLAGTWDAPALIDRLTRQIHELPCQEMDGIMTVDEARSHWWA